MCLQRLRDILFPLNVLAKDRRVITFDASAVPTVMYVKTLNIVWTGKRLGILSTTRVTTMGVGDKYRQERTYYTDGNGSSETYSVQDGTLTKTTNFTVYFDCTNVTSLIVNGTTII